MPDQPLNPDAVERTVAEVYGDGPVMDWPSDMTGYQTHRDYARSVVKQIVSAYLAHARPVVSSVPGVYDINSPEPEGVDQVVECDELGHPYKREWDEDTDYAWSKTTDGTRWKGYKNGKEYVEWPELVRRYGPVKAVTPEGGGDAT